MFPEAPQVSFIAKNNRVRQGYRQFVSRPQIFVGGAGGAGGLGGIGSYRL